MAIDINNRNNPTDPDAVYSLDTKYTTPGWVKDKDWSTIYTDEKSAKAAGANNKISVATLITNNGKKYDVVVGADGQAISATGDSTGQDDEVTRRWQQAAPKPLPPGGSPTQRRQAPDGQFHIYGYNPQTGQYDIDQGSVAATTTTRTPEKEADDKSAENEKAWNAANGPGGKGLPGGDPSDIGRGSGFRETHLERRTREAKEKKEADDKAQAATTAAQTAATAAAASRRADSAEARAVAEASRVGSKVEDIVVNGQHYTKITKTSADGKTTTIEHYGPNGSKIDAIPGEGAATVGGPPMPEIVVGLTEQALTAYHTALYNDPTLTDATRQKRFQEAVQVANLATQNAATQQREMESQRNTEYNVAGSKLTFMKGGMDSALKFVGDLNGTLPKGSDLGGRAFAAILGLQMLQMKMSGMDDITKPGTSASRAQVPTITARDLSNNAALTSHNAAIATQATAAAEPPPAATPPAVAPATAASSAPRPTAAAPSAQASGAPAVAPTIADPTITDQAYVGPPSVTPTGPAGIPVDAGELGQPGDPGYATPVTPQTPEASPIPSDMPSATPVNYGSSDMRVLPQPTPPTQYGDASDMQGMSFGDWPALAQIATPPPPQHPTAPSSNTGDPAMMAARKAQIAATPPWRIDDDDWEWANANGLLDDARRVPAMGRVA